MILNAENERTCYYSRWTAFNKTVKKQTCLRISLVQQRLSKWPNINSDNVKQKFHKNSLQYSHEEEEYAFYFLTSYNKAIYKKSVHSLDWSVLGHGRIINVVEGIKELGIKK